MRNHLQSAQSAQSAQPPIPSPSLPGPELSRQKPAHTSTTTGVLLPDNTLMEPLTTTAEELVLDVAEQGAGKEDLSLSAECLICLLPMVRNPIQNQPKTPTTGPQAARYIPPSFIRTCQCQYLAHPECLHEWYMTKPECPMCRACITLVNPPSGRHLPRNNPHSTSPTPTVSTLSCRLILGIGCVGWVLWQVLHPYTNSDGGDAPGYPNRTYDMPHV